jgi:hypothetical protein
MWPFQSLDSSLTADKDDGPGDRNGSRGRGPPRHGGGGGGGPPGRGGRGPFPPGRSPPRFGNEHALWEPKCIKAEYVK